MNERFIQVVVVVAAIAATVAAALLVLERFDGEEKFDQRAFSQTVVDSTVTQLLPEIAKIGQELTKTVNGFLSLIADRVDENRLRRRDVVSAFCDGKTTTQIVAAFGYERNRVETIVRAHARQEECSP